MSHQSDNIPNAEPMLDGVSLESLKQELDRRNEELLRLQIEANDRWCIFEHDATPNRGLFTIVMFMIYGVVMLLLRHHLPFNGKMPLEVLPTLSLFGIFIPVIYLIYYDNKIWQKFRLSHPQDAALIDSFHEQEREE